MRAIGSGLIIGRRFSRTLGAIYREFVARLFHKQSRGGVGKNRRREANLHWKIPGKLERWRVGAGETERESETKTLTGGRIIG